MNDSFAICQVYYGSTSGRSNYQILCASTGVSEDVLRAVDQHANLGGSALAGQDPLPIYAFYKVDNGLAVYAMTGFPSAEMGPRGNDYLVHALILDEAALSLLKGQIFLLNHLFQTTQKPEKDDLLNPILVNKVEYARKAAQPGNVWLKPGFSDEFMAFLLTRLSMGPVAALSKKPDQNMALCQSLFALLTPDDRMNFSFCTHFSYNRHLNYKFALFPEADRELVDRYQVRGGSTVVEKLVWPENSEAKKNRFLLWMDRIREGWEPIFGFSLLAGVRDALELDNALKALNQWVKQPKGESPLNRLDPRVRELLLKIGRDRYNMDAPDVAPIFEICILESFKDRVARGLNGDGDCLVSIRKDALNIRRVLDADAARAATMGRMLLDGGGPVAPAIASALALVLYLPDQPVLKYVSHPTLEEAVFAGPGDAGQQLLKLTLANRDAAEGLTARWLSLWHDLVPGGGYETWSRMIQGVCDRNPKRKALFWDMFMAACMMAVSDRRAEEQQRILCHLINDLRPRIPKLFTSDQVLKLVVEGDLLRGLEPLQVKELLPPLFRRHIPYMEKVLRHESLFLWEQLHVPHEMMAALTRMLNKNSRKYPHKKAVKPEYWNLIIESLKNAKMCMDAYRGEELTHFAQNTLYLVWAASQNMTLDRILKDHTSSKFLSQLSNMLYFLMMEFPQLDQNKMVHIVRHLTASANREDMRVLKKCVETLKENTQFVNEREENMAFLEHLLTGVRRAMKSGPARSGRSRGGRS